MHRAVIKAASPVTNVRVVSRTAAKRDVPIPASKKALEEFISPNPMMLEHWTNLMKQYEVEKEAARSQGIVEGRSAGIEEGRNEVAEAAESLKRAVMQLTADTDRFFFDAESFMVKLAIKIAEKVIGKNLSNDEELVKNLVGHTLRWVKNGERVVVRVNPEDSEILSAKSSDTGDGDGSLKFISDAKIERGGCVLETEWGVIDAQISTQLEEIYTKLVGTDQEGS